MSTKLSAADFARRSGSEVVVANGNTTNIIIMISIFVTAIFALPIWNWVSKNWNKRLAYIIGVGFWAVVIPGVIHERQPWFNESRPVPTMRIPALPLMREIPVDGDLRMNLGALGREIRHDRERGMEPLMVIALPGLPPTSSIRLSR